MKNENLKFEIQVTVAVVGVLAGLYLIIVMAVAWANTETLSSHCQYVNGSYDKGYTGSYWLTDPLSAGMSGKCISGGSK